jgi:hypothetical protein
MPDKRFFRIKKPYFLNLNPDKNAGQIMGQFVKNNARKKNMLKFQSHKKAFS